MVVVVAGAAVEVTGATVVVGNGCVTVTVIGAAVTGGFVTGFTTPEIPKKIKNLLLRKNTESRLIRFNYNLRPMALNLFWAAADFNQHV